MYLLNTTFERAVIAAAAVALSTVTLVAATVAPASADQSALIAKLNAAQPTVLVVGESATRVN